MQTVVEETVSPRSGSQDGEQENMKIEEEDEAGDDDLSRAGISTRGMNRRGEPPKEDAFNNDDLDMTQVPQVSILDTEGKNVLKEDGEDTDEEQQ